MKKIISILIASIILTLSVFSVNAFAATPKTEELLNQIDTYNQASTTISSDETDILKAFGMNANNYLAFKDNMFLYEVNTGIVTIRILSVDDSTYFYLPNFPLYYIKTERIFGVERSSKEEVTESLGLPNADFEFVNSYEETLNSKTYYVEEYTDEKNEPVKYYYSGDELKHVVSTVSDGTIYTLNVDEFSFEVDDDDFAPPKFAMDVSFLIGFLALIF